MNAGTYEWCFFIAHTGADKETAEALYDQLAPHAPTFLDIRCIELGDDWDRELAKAQKNALISVVLVSANSEQAYYEREEIAAAIAMARADDKKHRVVPLFLDDEAARLEGLYGLRLKHSLKLGHGFGIDEAAAALLGLLQRQKHPTDPTTTPQEPRIPPVRQPPRAAWWIGTGVAAAVVLVMIAWWLVNTPPTKSVTPPGPALNLLTGNCLKVEEFSPNVIPHYLLNSFGSENFPYWLRIVARNGCGEDSIMTLRFERSDNVALANPPQIHEFTVHQGAELERTFTPRFDLAMPQLDRLVIHWSIEDKYGTRIKSESIRTDIVEPLTVAWDLQKPEGAGKRVPVEREFLLGTLKAWILKPPRRVTELGRACRATPASGVLLEREEAIRACYRHLFVGNRALLVSNSLIKFPAGVRQRIRSHVQLIEDRNNKATSLEAALLYTAVFEAEHKDGIDPDLVLFVAPVDGATDPNLKTVFIGWRESGRPWRAVDFRLANEQGFDGNVATASERVAALLAENADMAKAMEKMGVGFSKDGRFAALSFAKVPSEYRIRALP